VKKRVTDAKLERASDVDPAGKPLNHARTERLTDVLG
jgi:hypothetical protein